MGVTWDVFEVKVVRGRVAVSGPAFSEPRFIADFDVTIRPWPVIATMQPDLAADVTLAAGKVLEVQQTRSTLSANGIVILALSPTEGKNDEESRKRKYDAPSTAALRKQSDELCDCPAISAREWCAWDAGSFRPWQLPARGKNKLSVWILAISRSEKGKSHSLGFESRRGIRAEILALSITPSLSALGPPIGQSCPFRPVSFAASCRSLPVMKEPRSDLAVWEIRR
jgi:hypothetical protein